jgi:glycosyltransferase involved in cell wall biosynthesis
MTGCNGFLGASLAPPRDSDSNARVTWLLPVRNGMPYLTEALASIEAQSYRPWEILAWDNGSSDGTVEELNRWIPERLPGRVVADRPMALGDARAQLVVESPTDLCAWIDADDVNEPCRLDLQVRFMAAHPEVAAVGGQLEIVDHEGNVIGTHGRFALDDHEIVSDMLDGPGMAQPAVLFRRSAVLAVGNYRHVGSVHVEDYDMWLRLATRAKLANIDQIVLKYRVHERSTTVTSERQGTLRPAGLALFADHAPSLYGCSTSDAYLLSRRRHPFALPTLIRMARHLRKRSGVAPLRTLRSGRFGQKAQQLLAPWDAPTRWALFVLRLRPRRFLRHSRHATAARAGRIGVGVSSRAVD